MKEVKFLAKLQRPRHQQITVRPISHPHDISRQILILVKYLFGLSRNLFHNEVLLCPYGFKEKKSMWSPLSSSRRHTTAAAPLVDVPIHHPRSASPLFPHRRILLLPLPHHQRLPSLSPTIASSCSPRRLLPSPPPPPIVPATSAATSSSPLLSTPIPCRHGCFISIAQLSPPAWFHNTKASVVFEEAAAAADLPHCVS